MDAKKELHLERANLQLNRSIIVDSINNNTLQWQQQKTIEKCIQLSDAMLQAQKNTVTNEHICRTIADMEIQIQLLTELYGASNIQLFINDRLIKISNRNKRLNKRVKKVGFANGMDHSR